ncbi:MAG: aspartate--tRNA(Asn) ligase [Candidatus Bathyarchaeia archaeon]
MVSWALDQLEDWRRTHYSLDVSPEMEGEEITVFGYVASVREQKGVLFIILEDAHGNLQITVNKGDANSSVRSKLETVKKHFVIGVKGRVKAFAKAPGGVEIMPNQVKILSAPVKAPPFDLYGWKNPGLEKRFDLRALDLRRPRMKAIFRIRHTTLHSLREALHQRGFIEVHTPKLISSATEGGAALFPILYYDKEAFLAQSPQLYKEQLASVFEKVYEVGPIFRAEKFRTLRHLSESISLDVEEAYVNYFDSMRLLEELIINAIDQLNDLNRRDLELLNTSLERPKTPFKRIKYEEAIEELRKRGVEVEWGEDFSTGLREIKHNEFYFILDWPTKSKAFYIKPKMENPELCEGFDLFYGSLELSSGGTRIDCRETLEKRLEEQGLKPANFRFHLDVFDYGIPPHAGFGLGLERLLMALTNQTNIREVTFYPRDPARLTP